MSTDRIGAFLTSRYGPIDDLMALEAGGWSSAYALRAGGRELILRLGRHREDFEKERVAATWQAHGIPIPEVLDLGEAFDGFFVISQRHHGTKLADLDATRTRQAIESLIDVLVAMRAVELPGTGFGIWLAPGCDAPARSWASYVCGVGDRDETRLVGWRGKLAAHRIASSAFHRGVEALQSSTVEVPTARGLVHADLLLNVLVDDDDRISAVFDWGNSMAGDPLFDVAWIAYCVPWFPAIDREHVLDLARRRFPDDDIDGLIGLYELHIAVGELQYQSFNENTAGMSAAAGRIDRLVPRS